MGNPTTTSKNLGLVKAIHVGTNPPSNINMIWADTNGGTIIHKYFDTTTQTWIPLGTNIGGGGTNITMNLGLIYFVCQATGDDTTAQVGSLLKPFETINGAMSQINLLNNLSSINRAQIVILPGVYNESVIISKSFVSIKTFTEKSQLFKDVNTKQEFDELVSSYLQQKRDVKVQLLKIENAKESIEVNGLDIETFIIKEETPPNGFTTRNTYQNLILTNFNFETSVGNGEKFVSGNFIDIVCLNLFGSNVCDLRNSYIKDVFANNGMIIENSIRNCVLLNVIAKKFYNFYKTNCENVKVFGEENTNPKINEVEDSNFNNCYFCDECVTIAINSTFHKINGGKNCIKDFINIEMKNSKFIDFGNGTNIPEVGYVSGKFDDVVAEFLSFGFANGRPFYGSIRNMVIHTESETNPCVNVYYDSNLKPTIIEYSTLKNCSRGGETVIGGFCFISHCKFNKIWSCSNIFGSPSTSYNIVSNYICSFQGILEVCEPPIDFMIGDYSVDNVNLTINMGAIMPINRQGTEIEITNLQTNITTYQVVEVGNNGNDPNAHWNLLIPLPIGHSYRFRIRTICQLDEESNTPISVSSFSQPKILDIQ